MVWLPIPSSLVSSVRNIFRGSTGRVLWKLFVLVVGGLVVYLATVATSSYLVTAVIGIVVWIALSGTVRSVLKDIWSGDFYRL